MPLVPTPKNCDPSVKKAIQILTRKLGSKSNPTFTNLTLSQTCNLAAGLNVLRVTGLQTDDTALTGTLRGAYIDVSNGSTAATGTIRAMELKARTEAPGDTGNNVAVLEGLSISADSKAHNVTTMRAAEFILDGKTAGTIDEAVGLRIANNLQVDKATLSYGLQIYRDSFDYTYDISLSLGGHITGDSYVNQDLRTTASPVFVGGTFSAVVTGVTPTAGEHLATKEYVDLALGTFKTFFISDIASGVGSLNYAYPHETGGGQSTIVNDGFEEEYGTGTHLHQGYITEAGEPATTTIHAGVIVIHFHAKKGASNQRITTLQAVISSVDADGSTGKTTLATSEVTAELTDVETNYTIHAVMGSDVEVASTSRLICDVYANVTTGAQDSVVSLYMEGTEDSYFTTKVDSGIWQNHGDVLDDLNATGVNTFTGDPVNDFLVGTAAGTLVWQYGATARTSMGVGTGDSPQFTGIELGHANDTTITRVSAGVIAVEGVTVMLVGGAPTAHTIASHSDTTGTGAELNTLTDGSDVGALHSHAAAYQPLDAELTSLAALSYVAASFVKMTGANTFALRTLQQTSDDLESTIDHDNLLNFAANEHFLQSAITTVSTIATGVWQATDVGIAYGGTGQSTAQLAINALTAVSGATNEHVLTKDTGTGNAVFKAAAGGVSTWIALTDTDPANYVGEAGNTVIVNAGETGLEFGSAPGISNLDGGSSATVYSGVTGTPIDGGSA